MSKQLLKQILSFNEEEHRYYDKNNVTYISASQLLEKYKPPFDPDGSVLKKCAEEKGVTPEELQAEWDKIRNDACIRGTLFHSQAEAFINTNIVADGPDKDIIEDFRKIKFDGNLLSEQRLHSNTCKLAGTADLLEMTGDTDINLYDFKTNKKLEKFSIFGNRMLFPINHIYECNFNVYQLQLSLYAYMLEEHGYWVNKMALFYINPRTRKIETHEVKYLKTDVENILLHYTKPESFAAELNFGF